MAERKNPLAKANQVKKDRRARASKMTEALVAASGETPLQHLLTVMRNPRMPRDFRLEAAKAAAPYVHPKLATVTHVGDAENPVRVACTVYVPKKEAPRNG